MKTIIHVYFKCKDFNLNVIGLHVRIHVHEDQSSYVNLFITFLTVNTCFYPMNKKRNLHKLLFSHWKYQKCYFHTENIKSVIFNVKITSNCDATLCNAYICLKETCSKTQENVINRKFNAFDIKYGIYFTRESESF